MGIEIGIGLWFVDCWVIYFILGYIMKIQEIIELKNMLLRKIKNSNYL